MINLITSWKTILLPIFRTNSDNMGKCTFIISAYSELFMKIKRNNRIWSIHNTLPLSLLLSHFSKDKK